MGIIVVAGTLWVFRPHAVPNPAVVEPRLTALREPFRVVRAGCYADGGSIGVEIVDADGRRELFSIPCEHDAVGRFETVFVGAKHYSEAGAVPVSNPEPTKQTLIIILSHHTRDRQIALAVADLTGRIADHARVIYHWAVRDFRRP